MESSFRIHVISWGRPNVMLDQMYIISEYRPFKVADLNKKTTPYEN